MECVCKQCGRAFPVVASRKRRTLYCSRECKSAAQENKIEGTCAYPACGKTFFAKASQKRKYCCKECFYDDRAIPIKPFGFTDLEKSEIEGLFIQYERKVWAIARKLHLHLSPVTMELADFVQEGYIGLMQAYRNDDERGERSFGGFAGKYIYMEIMAAWRYKDHGIRLPESLFRHDAKITEQKEQYKAMVFRHCSLEALNGWYPNANPSAEQETIRREQIQELYQSLLTLPSLQRSLIAEHYGLTGEEVAQRQLCYRYSIPTTTMHRLLHGGLNALQGKLNQS